MVGAVLLDYVIVFGCASMLALKAALMDRLVQHNENPR